MLDVNKKGSQTVRIPFLGNKDKRPFTGLYSAPYDRTFVNGYFERTIDPVTKEADINFTKRPGLSLRNQPPAAAKKGRGLKAWTRTGKLYSVFKDKIYSNTTDLGVTLRTTSGLCGFAETRPGATNQYLGVNDGDSLYLIGVDDTVIVLNNVAITSSSVANPTVITANNHGLATGNKIIIRNHTGSTPSINNTVYTVTVTGANTFTIPVNVTVGGTGGTIGSFPTPNTRDLVYVDTYWYVMKANAAIYNCNVDDPTTWDNNFIFPQQQPGNGVGIAHQNSALVAFTDKHMQLFENVVNPSGSPLQNIPGAMQEVGCFSHETLAFLEKTGYFVSNNQTGGLTVFRMDGLTNLKDIGTSALNRDLTQNFFPFKKQIVLSSGTSWTVPADWNPANNKIECIGAGGGGDLGSRLLQDIAGPIVFSGGWVGPNQLVFQTTNAHNLAEGQFVIIRNHSTDNPNINNVAYQVIGIPSSVLFVISLPQNITGNDGSGGTLDAIASAGGGGGGGAYAFVTNFDPGAAQTIPYTIGQGGFGADQPVGVESQGVPTDGSDTTFNTTTVIAKAGKKAVIATQIQTPATGGAGGLASACTPSGTAKNGGTGGNAYPTSPYLGAGGGGGGAAGSTNVGSTGSNGGATLGGTGGQGDDSVGGLGGQSGQTGQNGRELGDASSAGSGGGGGGGPTATPTSGSNGGLYGGGGGGGSTGIGLSVAAPGSGGDGANGVIIITYTPTEGGGEGYILRLAGHTFYVLSLDAVDTTYVYDQDLDMWTEWNEANADKNIFKRWPIVSVAQFFDSAFLDASIVGQDRTSGHLWSISTKFGTDNGVNYNMVARTQPLMFGTRRRKFYNKVTILADDTQTDAFCTLSYSDADYFSIVPHRPTITDRTINIKGADPASGVYTLAQPFSMNWGSSRKRAWQFSYYGSIPSVRIDGLEFEIEFGED